MAVSSALQNTYYRYIMHPIDIIIPGEQTETVLVSHIKSFSIEKDFDNDFFPILQININLTPTLYHKIMMNKTTTRFRIRLDKYIYNSKKSTKFKGMLFNALFAMFTDDNSVFIDEDLYKKTKEIQGKNSAQFTELRNVYTFYVFKESDVLSTKKIVNTVICDNNMENTASYLLSSAGASNVLMTPFDNSKIYKEILIPPVSILDSINYLDSQYGFYEHGKLVFFDFDITYFINKRGMCTAYKLNEYKDVIVTCYKSSNPESISMGNYKNDIEKTYVLNVSIDKLHMRTNSIIANQLEGNELISVSPETGDVNIVSPSVQQRGDKLQRMVVNNFNNIYTNKSMEYRKLENDGIIVIDIADVDIECLTPNKHFIFAFEETKIQIQRGGSYRLAYEAFDFSKEGDEFSIAGQAMFKKIK